MSQSPSQPPSRPSGRLVAVTPPPRPASRLSRRHLVGGVAATAGLGALLPAGRAVWTAAADGTPAAGDATGTPAAHHGAGTPAPAMSLATPEPVAFVTGEPLANPPALRSENGRLEVEFVARRGETTIGGQPVIAYTYNGITPAPTLIVRPGDTLAVRVVNELDEPTNLHTHGVHISPSGNSDNVLLTVAPGETFDWEFNLPGADISGLYTPGFFWYHPHIHGFTSPQAGGGMAGALIIEGALDELPGVAGTTERVLILQVNDFPGQPTSWTALVNGLVQPVIDIAPGEVQRWRVLNASDAAFVDLALDGHQLHQIAADGNPLDVVLTKDSIFLAPGERAEVLIQGGEAGTHAFHSLAWGIGFQAQPDFPVATVQVSGDAVTSDPLPTTLVPFDDLGEAAIDRSRTVVFAETATPFNVFVNGRMFDHDRVDQTVILGQTEEWRIVNTSPDWHPFHIHVNDFQVMSVNGEPHAAHSLEDTFAVPANGEIVIRSRFLDFPGTFVYHCHILPHEDMGMMGIVEVVDPAAT